MADLDLAALKAAADELPSAEWSQNAPEFAAHEVYCDDDGETVAFATDHRFARWIALANPATILALVERVRRLEMNLATVDRALIRAEPPPDWACRECRPGSDMLVDGFACAYHQAKRRVAALNDKDKEATNG